MKLLERITALALLYAAITSMSAAMVITPMLSVTTETTGASSLSPRLQQIFAHSKSVCFGRFVIELPASAIVVFGRMTVDSEVFYLKGEAASVDKRIAEQVARIEKDTFANREMAGVDSLNRHVIEGGAPGQKTVIGADDGFYNIYSYAPVGDGLFILENKGGLSKTAELKKEIASFQSIASLIRPRAHNEIPNEPGICLEGGFINMLPEFENISIGIRMAEYPDIHLSIELLKNRGEIDTSVDLDYWLKHSAETASRERYSAWYASIKLLRQGPRKIGDWTGKEALARKPSQEGSGDSHQFVFQALGDKSDPMLPQAKVELFSGLDGNKLGGKPPSLSDAESVALWDKLTSSIRARATAPPNSSDAGPPPLGTTVFAGHPCPQQGWWDCGEEGGNIETFSGRRQFFRLRDAVPQAVLFRRPTLLQRIGGAPKTFQLATPTMWTLVAYDAATLEKITAAQTSAP